MANAFINSSRPSNTMMAAEATCWNSSCGCPVQLKIWMGSVVKPDNSPLGS